LSGDEWSELVQHLERFARAKPVQDLLANCLQEKSSSLGARKIVLQAMARSSLKEAPSAWVTGVTHVLESDDGKLIADAIAAARAMTVPKQQIADLAQALQGIAHSSRLPDAIRLNALAAVPGGLAKVEPSQFDFLRAHLSPEETVAARSAAVDVLAHARMTSEQLIALCGALKTVGPMEIDRVLEAFAQSSDEKVGGTLIAALKSAPARSSLRIDAVKPRLAKFGPNMQKQAEELYVALDADASKQRARLEQLLASLHGGDVRRGQAVFNSTKAACASCHAIGYLGGNIGPDLTRIGGIRSERDLLESIVFPSASFVRSYEPVLVATKSGKFYNGLVRKDSPDEIVLALNATEEARISRKDIEDVQPSKVSIMPAGLDQQLSVQDLADLVAFLKACK
jgi:putative heme-binding domain-containing protein